jgi:hypothetical protein
VHARTFEGIELRAGEPPIARAARDHDRTGAHALVVEQLQDEGRARRIARDAKPDRLVGDRHLDPELLRLGMGARHQGHAADSSWEAKIVLDAGGGAGLAPERAAVEHQHGQPFRGGINRRRKSGRPRPHDRDVVDAVGIDRPHHADAARQLVLSGIAQQLAIRAEHDRQLAGIDMEALDQRSRLGISVGVEPLTRMAVAAEEAFEPEHVGVVGAADDHRSARPQLEQADPAQNEGAHDALTQLRFRDQ